MPPFVSVIVPCLNEKGTIYHLLDAIYAQTYPRGKMEVVIADGLSQDGTRAEIEAFRRAHTDLSVHVVDNPARIIPAALNCAIRAARGEVIVRLDAHSAPYPDYIERCLEALGAGMGENVGGVWEIRPGGRGWMAASIAAAAAHPLGAGDARYRLASRPAAVDTVPFGAFRRALIDRIGGFDETLLTNEDYEFNARVRASGGRVWLEPRIRSVYFARSSLRGLARQYWRYGYWKCRMLRRYPGTLRWRQALPPVFVASLLALLAVAVFLPQARFLLTLETGLYAIGLLAAGLEAALRQRNFALFLGLPLAVATMHLAWGGGFLWNIITRWSGADKNG